MREFLLSVGYDRWILPTLLIIPILGALAVLAGGRQPEGEDEVVSGAASRARVLATVFFAIEFFLSLGLWWAFDPAAAGWQQRFDMPWIPSWGARFTVGLDGIAMMMVLLTTLIMLLASIGSWTSVRQKASSYYALLLVLTTGMLGVFMALDLFLFYIMWEVMLIPMYFIIGIWGGQRRIYASLKFFIYTMLGSLLMLVGIIYLGVAAQQPHMVNGAPVIINGVMEMSPNFSYDAIMAQVQLTPQAGLWLFGAFFLAFAVKVPMFPLHTWLPDAHVEAPTAGSVVLASIMLKLGTFGFIRLAVPLFPAAAMNPTVRNIVLILAVIGIVYGALLSLVQPDFKKLVAYSSVSHLGFVMLGIFALTVQSVQGAFMVMINHGLSTGALFFLIGMLYERRHTRLIAAYGGIARAVPLFSAILVFVSFSSVALPGTNGFVGEFLVLLGTYRTYPVLAVVATTSVIITAAYMLWAIQRIIFNPLDKPENEHIPDMNRRELLLMAPLLAGMLWLGVYPAPVLRRLQPSAENFVRIVELRSSAANASTAGGR
ncbi:MAG: NADH-quinone oxidoreductase subunit M [Gemmatimonadota bacterium]|nr:NADH-quinone oxidoreductase subunit M [Gemmatimonadota bacterium]